MSIDYNDVEFAYTQGDQHITRTLYLKDRKTSRGALGIWRVDVLWSWKVYRSRRQLQRLYGDYQRADTAGLPMDKPRFVVGRIRSRGRTTSGFVLIARWMEGTQFLNKATSFRAALDAQMMPHDRTDQNYIRTTAGCLAAQSVGLRDCQGFVKMGERESLQFFDIHTRWNPIYNIFGSSIQADALVQVIESWESSI
ncbi:uncharacterized protein PHACADRAFT_101432 [Phanerochaete carnosa HHB-10118-sp]|uniref:Fungal-type protein kinase domain-containing protein n=1 Tax=Phanerochaete carnosa (strain HHB-10118-sp) TaxID=650164 RepID=K5VKM5_PHACS|nr:uncharacterized protein PHACADRAFT_101432 [Phanerochaete carnosa HHB-10118-sp]EKM51948.1 hypothetical protein PHACADRAFT_101432 [Phanerochaete carnosa HHB-10118-sp]